MDPILMILFWGAMATNVVTVILYSSIRKTAWLYLIPWTGLMLGFAWFAGCRSYFAQPEVSLEIPIRIDLVLLPPLMVFSLFAGVARIIRAKRKDITKSKT